MKPLLLALLLSSAASACAGEPASAGKTPMKDVTDITVGLSPASAASAKPGEPLLFLEVHNTGHRLFQQVVEHKGSLAALFPGGIPESVTFVETDDRGRKLRDAVGQIDAGDGLKPALQTGDGLKPALQTKDKAALLSLLLDGITEPGQRRYFLIKSGWSEEPPTDLRVDTARGDDWSSATDLISNQYFTVQMLNNWDYVHDRSYGKGHGGFPERLLLNGSGNSYGDFYFGDRLFTKERGTRELRDDSNAMAESGRRGPLRIVMETTARYGPPDRYASGEAKAVYRYVFRAYSPIVEVTCSATRNDDYRWSELHFLQISRKDSLFSRWVGGEPVQSGAFTNSKQGKTLPRWAVVHNADDAIGLAHPDGVILYDGLDYCNYLQTPVIAWERRTYENAARLYIGPALRDPQEYARFFAGPSVAIRQLPLPREAKPPAKGKYQMRTDALRLEFADEDAGLGLVCLSDPVTGEALISSPEDKPLLWRIELRAEDKSLKPITLDNRVDSKRSASMAGGKLEFRWDAIALGDEPGALSVIVTVEPGSDDPQSGWRLKGETLLSR